jgi:hypothetical protein
VSRFNSVSPKPALFAKKKAISSASPAGEIAFGLCQERKIEIASAFAHF